MINAADNIRWLDTAFLPPETPMVGTTTIAHFTNAMNARKG